MNFLYYKAVNWDELQDTLDQYTWEKLTNNFWLDTRLPLKENLFVWENLAKRKKENLNKMMASLSLNYALQSEYGAPSLRRGIQTQQEEAVLNITTFMESVHTKAMTTFFRAFLTEDQTAEYYAFADRQVELALELTIIDEVYQSGSELQKKVAFLLGETVLAYGRLSPILVETQLVQTNQLIGNILRGGGIYCAYIGYKFQLAYQELPVVEQVAVMEWVVELVEKILPLEEKLICRYSTESDIAKELVHYATNYFFQLVGSSETVFFELPQMIGSKLDSWLTNIDDLRKEARQILSNQTEAMNNEDYEF